MKVVTLEDAGWGSLELKSTHLQVVKVETHWAKDMKVIFHSGQLKLHAILLFTNVSENEDFLVIGSILKKALPHNVFLPFMKLSVKHRINGKSFLIPHIPFGY